MKALLIGSIGVIAETSEMQRASFNEAFAAAGLDWVWQGDEYREMLTSSGGKKRIMAYAKARGQDVDADALHRHKSEIFQEKLSSGVPLRDGVADTMAQARDKGLQIAFVTTTTRENVTEILNATNLTRDDFDLVMDADMVSAAKPAPDAYLKALETLGVAPDEAVAIEDNPDGARAAARAGLIPYVTRGALHREKDFDDNVTFLDAMRLSD